MADEKTKDAAPVLTPRAVAARAAKDDRLAAALRENLKRRKDQARGRRGDAAPASEIKPKN